ncbi:MAG: 3-isopropylmalate dehydratase small subunit [Verrucomicrobia bacterium]|nr:3-isopropylmalate dehydratase small subunit [Verrucomicrobiota bacterium]
MKGKATKFGDNVDTDMIIAARYLVTTDAAEMAAHAFEDVRPGWPKKISVGDILVAGNNFGCGSSREHAPIAIKAAGVSCVVAASFARIFYRNAFNIGLPVLESAEASRDIAEGDVVEIDASTGVITDKTKGKTYQSKPIPPFMQELVKAGGLMAYLAKTHK